MQHGRNPGGLAVLENPVLKVLVAIADAVTPAEVHEALVDRVGEAVGASSVGLWLVDGTADAAMLVRGRGYSPAAESAMRRLDVHRPDSMPVLDAIRTGEAVWIPSQPALYERYPHLVDLATPGRSYRVSCLPLKTRGRVSGALALTIEAAGHATDDERDFLLLVARYASQAIERLSLYEAERDARAAAEAAAARLDVLNRASRTFASAELDLGGRLREVAAEMSRALDSSISLTLLGEEGLLHLVAVHHPVPEANEELARYTPSHPLRVGEGFAGAIAATGKSAVWPDLDREAITRRASPGYRAFLERFPSYAVAGAPLQVRGSVIGTVTAARARPGQSFESEDLRLLEELAERAAVAIENSRLYQESLDARTRAEHLYRFAQAVVAADRVEVVYEAALDSIDAGLGVTRAAILTFDDAKIMRFRAWRGLSDDYRAAVDGHSPWAADAVRAEPVVVGDALGDPAWAAYAEAFRREGIGSLAFIPVASRERLLGKVMVYSERPHAFSAQRLATARAIANHLGSVITRFEVVGRLEQTIHHNELLAGVLAHDLRNPISAITSGAGLLLASPDAEAERTAKTARRMMNSAELMARMIDELLDFTRARVGGGIGIRRQDVDLQKVHAAVVSQFELSHPGLKIAASARGNLSGSFDPDRLHQVFSNLISNAGTHGQADEPIRVALDGESPDAIVVRVHNRGAIPQSLLPHIFDPFRSTQRARPRSGGLGLGLFIVKEIVRAHGGTVDVSSSESAGTTVSVRLPR